MAAIKILSVDDEESIESLMRQYFRRKIRAGEYEFFYARNGVEALDVLNSNPDIEIILSDINMPVMDGLKLLANVNEKHNPALRVVMVSAYGDMQNIRQAMNSGAFDFVTKPIDMDDLNVTIEKAIGQIHYVHESQEEHTQLESLKKDLSVASEIQQYILPREFPPFPDVSDQLDIYASMEAAKDVGGDFYDFFRVDDDHIAFVIADVCGKGIPAALFMTMSRTMIRSKGMHCLSAAECMTDANRQLAANSVDCMFVTVFYAIYDITSGLVNYCSAGHNPPYLLHGAELSMVRGSKNPMLGSFDGIEYKEGTLQMEPGDTLVMYTDGVTEAMNASREELGPERFEQILQTVRDKSSEEIVKAVRTGIADFVAGAKQSDDITMLVIKRK